MNSTHVSLSQRVLDAATQLDRRLRDEGAPLDKVSDLVDLLSDPELRGDLLFQNDLWRALQKIGTRPSTVDQLNAAVEGELATIRSAIGGNGSAARAGLDFCLALHEVVLRGVLRTDRWALSSRGFAA